MIVILLIFIIIIIMSWKWDSSSAGCPGLYCGRIKLDNGSYSSCGVSGE